MTTDIAKEFHLILNAATAGGIEISEIMVVPESVGRRLLSSDLPIGTHDEGYEFGQIALGEHEDDDIPLASTVTEAMAILVQRGIIDKERGREAIDRIREMDKQPVETTLEVAGRVVIVRAHRTTDLNGIEQINVAIVPPDDARTLLTWQKKDGTPFLGSLHPHVCDLRGQA